MQENKKNLPGEVREGLSLLNQEQFYQAHESFESAWRKTEAPAREFFRALLHISGGFYRLSQNRPMAARKFFQHALKWLALFPDLYLGFDISRLKKDLQIIISALEKGQLEADLAKKLLHPIEPLED